MNFARNCRNEKRAGGALLRFLNSQSSVPRFSSDSSIVQYIQTRKTRAFYACVSKVLTVHARVKSCFNTTELSETEREKVRPSERPQRGKFIFEPRAIQKGRTAPCVVTRVKKAWTPPLRNEFSVIRQHAREIPQSDVSSRVSTDI